MSSQAAPFSRSRCGLATATALPQPHMSSSTPRPSCLDRHRPIAARAVVSETTTIWAGTSAFCELQRSSTNPRFDLITAKMPAEVSDIKQFIEICRRKDAQCTCPILRLQWKRRERESGQTR